ncbi:hypothetical protein [Streptomyces sp. NPDC058255]|uniref:hypothetical protein n=1 Tax=Streptomyces sp. NPDC058255 TaxID=3346407 RepID=UPI0036E37948
MTHPTDTDQPAAQIAAVISAAMAASGAGGRSPTDTAEILAITDAMVRLLIGLPLRSDGQLTIKSLAQEAGLKRNKLTHKHTGLKDLWYALVRAQHGRPHNVDGLHKKHEELKAKAQALREERDDLVLQVQQLVRVVQVLELENEQLRQSSQHPVILPLPRR